MKPHAQLLLVVAICSLYISTHAQRHTVKRKKVTGATAGIRMKDGKLPADSTWYGWPPPHEGNGTVDYYTSAAGQSSIVFTGRTAQVNTATRIGRQWQYQTISGYIQADPSCNCTRFIPFEKYTAAQCYAAMQSVTDSTVFAGDQPKLPPPQPDAQPGINAIPDEKKTFTAYGFSVRPVYKPGTYDALPGRVSLIIFGLTADNKRVVIGKNDMYQ